MKKVLFIATVITATVISTQQSLSQVYQFNETENFGVIVTYQGSFIGALALPNGQVSETVSINSSAGTIQDSGNINFPAETETISFQQMETPFPVFPNPPQTVTGDVQLSLSFAGGPIAFNTGVESLHFQSGTTWGFNGSIGLNLPLTLSCSVTSGGQTVSDSLATSYDFILNSGSGINIANYPGSIQLLFPNLPLFQAGADADTALSVTAPDGFFVNDVSLTPEPSSWVMLGAGAALVVFYKAKRRV